MRAFKRWLDRSLTAQAVLIFALGVGVTALFRPDEHPLVWVIQGALYATIAVVVVALQRRKASRAAGTDTRGVTELHRKIRHREVPKEPAERASMRRLVADQLGQIERGRRVLPYWLGTMCLAAVAALVFGVANGSWTLPLVFAVGVIAFCCWILWMRRRSIDRFRSMRSSLQSQ
ncbi:hypothetical protein AB0E78_35360 [Streptomyces sp. NPDC032198]|uniref:hypothetical protein n=1 Tax=Streptomyces sp. NPDC032198 TaxID=3155127 RepID=UPI0033E713A6